MKDSNLDLAIAPFTPTRARSLTQAPCSAIDLSFISSSLSNSLIFSKIALQFFHGSDHRPVLTSLNLNLPKKTWKPERNWKTLDSELARNKCDTLQQPFHFQNKHEVDEYLDYLNDFLQGIATQCTVAVHTVPPDQVRLIGSTGLDSGLVLAERSVKEWVGVLRDSGGGLLGTVLHTR